MSLLGTKEDISHFTIIQKLRNRKRLLSDEVHYVCDVIKRKYSKEASGEPSDSTVTQAVSTISCATSTQTEETDSVMLANLIDPGVIHFLKCQALLPRQQQNVVKVLKLMKSTFKARNHYILMDEPNISEVKEWFPILFEKSQILNELELIIRSTIVSEFYSNILKHQNAIMCCVKPLNRYLRITEEQQKIFKAKDKSAEYEEKCLYMNLVEVLVLLPSLLCENIEEIIKFETTETDSTLPLILCSTTLVDVLNGNATFQIVAENIKICETDDMIEAVLLYMSVYFIFHLVYNEKCNKTLCLIEMLFLNHDAECELKDVLEVYKMLMLWQ